MGDNQTQPNQETPRYFSLEELKQFDGKQGRPACIAFKGRVYDVTNSSFWKNGFHLGVHFAGEDLTGTIINAPHKEEVLQGFKIIGELINVDNLSL